MASNNQGTSEDTKTIVTALLLVFMFPVGFILMWAWTSWPKWVKWLISVVIILPILGIVSSIALIVANPAGQVRRANRAQCAQQCGGNAQDTACINTCMQQFTNPASSQ